MPLYIRASLYTVALCLAYLFTDINNAQAQDIYTSGIEYQEPNFEPPDYDDPSTRDDQVEGEPNASGTPQDVVDRHEDHVSGLKSQFELVDEKVDHDNLLTIMRDAAGAKYSVETDADGGQVVISTPNGNIVYDYDALTSLYYSGMSIPSKAVYAKISNPKRKYHIVFCHRIDSKETIDLSVIYQIEDSTWVTEGWFKIRPGKCELVAFTNNRIFYFHADLQNSPLYWRGPHKFCYFDSRHTFIESKDNTACPRGVRKKGYSKNLIPSSKNRHSTFTMDLQ